MTVEDLKKYEVRLEQNRAELLKKIKEEERSENFGDDSDHFDEEADEAEEIGNGIGDGPAIGHT